MDNDVSEAKPTLIYIRAVDSDGGSSRYSARILTTQSVFSENRCVRSRTSVCQTDDESVRFVSCIQILDFN